ncbi:MAG: outer membrane beta-barrel domain-containing protein [Pseudomonadota bacterium]
MTLKPAAVFALALLPVSALAQEATKTDSDTAAAAEESQEQVEATDSVGKPLRDRIKAVSRKSFLKKNRFEATPAFGLSVNDAFFRNYIVQLDATYHIVESFSLELRLGLPVFGEPLDPVEFLRSEYKTLTNIVRPAYLVQLSGNFTPLYGKVAMFSEWIWQYDLYLAGGVGVTGIGILTGARLDMSAIAHMPSMNVGVGMRSFITRWMVVHLDARDYIYPSVTDGLSNIQNLLVVSVGVGFFFPFDFEYEYEGYKVVQ